MNSSKLHNVPWGFKKYLPVAPNTINKQLYISFSSEHIVILYLEIGKGCNASINWKWRRRKTEKYKSTQKVILVSSNVDIGLCSNFPLLLVFGLTLLHVLSKLYLCTPAVSLSSQELMGIYQFSHYTYTLCD